MHARTSRLSVQAPLRRGSRYDHRIRAGPVTAAHPDPGVLGAHRLRGRARRLWRVCRLGVPRCDRSSGNNWFHRSDSGWFGGNWWWVAVTAAAGVAVGLLHRMTRLPEPDPQPYRRPPGGARRTAVGPGDCARLGGVADRGRKSRSGEGARRHGRRRGRLAAPTPRAQRRRPRGQHPLGFAGAYGGLFSAVVVVVMLIMEIARPGGTKLTKALPGMIVSSSISFGIYFAIAGSVFLDAYNVPSYKYEEWQLAAGFGSVCSPQSSSRCWPSSNCAVLFAKVKHGLARAAIGGALFGLVGVALPLTLFTGSEQLKTVVSDAGTLGRGPPRRPRDREDGYLRRLPGERFRRRPDLPRPVHRGGGRGRLSTKRSPAFR